MVKLLVVLTSVVVAAVSTGPHERLEEKRCSTWNGTVSGNDPDVSVSALLCERNDGTVVGELTWKSNRSGTSVRALEGKHKGDGIVLRDTAMSGSPNPGWRFCKIDRYELAGGGDSLSGSYVSTACHDKATISLHRVK